MSEEKKSGLRTGHVLLGAALAALAGYLFADKQARKKLKDRLIRGIEESDAKLDDLNARAKELLDSAVKRADSMTEAGKRKLVKELESAKAKVEKSLDKKSK